ncbi:PREDICTED: protein RoBo-1-like [Dipodomys ordii]|uniref:Protein RoBo-1-like n=1 Tax=Dipodomys ordii TaxID=10020 RepID=A0A1S3F5D5_DIPOR|nr:PREDICTED: protein RoBo-1-like [Dipodomys ordii]XP_012871051.1 PREDICTED: protein RoBo-1-like [Dipodomys ordii]XP_012871052.1 PREDICTED: protein RoBo-1-like [Dipodomys ordii]
MPRLSVPRSLLRVCVLAICVFSTVETFTCEDCQQDTCTQTPKTCESADSCFTNMQFWNKSGTLVKQHRQKGCLSGCVPLSFSATLGEQRTFEYNNQCCQTDKCNKNFPVFQKSSVTNGVECPACYAERESSCVPAPLKCTGTEKSCVEVTGTGTVGGQTSVVFFGKGCATESACNLEDVTVIDSTQIHTTCPRAVDASPRQASTISSVLAGVFLLKLLL